MNYYDLAIINGNIYSDGQFIKGNLYIKKGVIESISKELIPSKEIYDVKGNYVLPGFIDPHVHFDLNIGKNKSSADDFYNGSVTAAYGGVTTFIDFLDPVRNVEELQRAYDSRMEKAKMSIVDYGFHSTIANFEEDENIFVHEIKKMGMCSIKFFTTYSSTNRKTSLQTIKKLLKISRNKGVMLLSHSENDELIREGKFKVTTHEENRPTISEIIQVLTLSELAKTEDGLMYIVHLSSGETLKRLKENYNDILNKNIFIESCPQYFYLSKENYKTEDGFLYTLAPPLRGEDEIELLKNHIDYVNTIGTDHCPFKSYEKYRETLDLIPMGIGGIEHSFNLMYTLLGEKIIDKFTKNPAKLHGLYPKKGILSPGSDGDIVIFDPKEEYIITESHSKCDYDLYEGINVKGRIISTILRGNFIIKDGELVSNESGQYIKRKLK
ncbi:MAG: amidohydrolase family protein [Clostridium sp.]|uniref:dihydroorotase n=1 Tax=Clostridium sp. TaxID=1506 RepID=UPI003062B1E4